MDYQQAWKFLDDLQFFKIKLGLDAMDKFLARLGNPHHDLKFIHIGGTNGKGSVAANLHSILGENGYKTGFYSSPHLSCVRERFRINQSYIPEDDFSEIATDIANILDKEQITYFEFTTAMALLWFRKQNVDVAILEVGMGGRLDATNVVTPMVSAITNVSFDHQQYLGDTIIEIAKEKAGIIKDNIPVVSGLENSDVFEIINSKCLQKNSPHFHLGRDFSGQRTGPDTWNYRGIKKNFSNLPIKLKGDYQIGNSCMALAICELITEHGFLLTEGAIRAGLAKTSWPGRLEVIEKEQQTFLIDGAHNVAGVKALKRALSTEFDYDKLILVWAAMEDKDIAATLDIISPLAETIVFTAPKSERATNPGKLQEIYQQKERKENSILAHDVEKAINTAINLSGENDLICIGGSLYLAGEARLILKGELVAE